MKQMTSGGQLAGCPFGGVCVDTCALLLSYGQDHVCALAKMAEDGQYNAKVMREDR